MANWVNTLNDIMLSEGQNIDDLFQSSTQAKGHDVGFVNKKTGAGILARDTGVLESFAYYNLGMRMDPESMTISFFAPTIQMFCSKYQVYEGADASAFQRINQDYQDVLDMIGGKVDDKV
jgi:peptide deformylase